MPYRYKRTPFFKKTAQTIETHQMLQPGESILMGVSGGPDSVALALSLAAIRKELRLNLGIAHINHLLRGKEADRDETFVKELAGTLDLSFHLSRVDVATLAMEEKKSLEETARDVRYTFFKKTCRQKGYTKLAVGHTLDDNAELVLMNLLRGSGPRGLSGIPPVRDGWIIRPLIEHSKNEILTFLKEKNQEYVIDSTNIETVFLRNRIRNKLLPLIEQEYNPGITENLNRVSRIMREEEAWMETEATAAFRKILVKESDTEISVCLDLLKNLPPALKRRVARKAIARVKGNLRRITLAHIDAVTALAAAISPAESLDLPDQIRIIKQEDSLCFKKESRPLREIGKNRKMEKRSRNKRKVFLA